MLNNYQVIQKLGEGMFGSVYLVKNQKGEKFAFKTIKLNPFTAEESMREVQATKLLEHPNLVRIHDFKVSEDFLQILMEYCEKGNFQSYLKSSLFKDKSELSLAAFRQIVQAGVAMIRQGVIHRDIKPENIMVSQTNKGLILKLGDFGCATRQNQATLTVLSNSFDKGTAMYASPELLDNNAYSSKCDVWSGGCLLYQMYFGSLPFEGDSIQEIKIKIKQFTNSYKFPENCHPRIQYFIKLSLQYEQSERASWRQLQYHLITMNRNSKDCFLELLNYFYQLTGIATIISKQIWQNRKDSDLNKETHKAFAFYMTGLEYSIHKMIVDLIEETQEFRGFYNGHRSNDKATYEKFMKKSMKNQAVAKQIYDKIEGHLREAPSTKRLIEKIPTKRTAVFAHIDYSRKYAKKLLHEVFCSSNPQIKIKENRGYKLLSKWINFNKWYAIDRKPSVKDVQKETVDRTTLSWIKEELSEAQK